MNIRRVWAMPNSNTFQVTPIGDLVKRCLRGSRVSIDPFARDNEWATYTNDLNPKTAAKYHLDVLDFLQMMLDKGVEPDLIIFDPPYSPRQIKECYEGIGLKMGGEDAWRTAAWTKERDLMDRLLMVGGRVISCGWNSMGMGQNRPYTQDELLIVCHGASHNDTMVMVETKTAHQAEMALP